ncbi:MAG: hypothetical protein V7K35_00870 [Nostoc sp.]
MEVDEPLRLSGAGNLRVVLQPHILGFREEFPHCLPWLRSAPTLPLKAWIGLDVAKIDRLACIVVEHLEDTETCVDRVE